MDSYCEGLKEVVLTDRTRADCLTETHAIEYEFARKWKNSIGQALHYALKTGRQAGIVLIATSEKDMRYVSQLSDVILKNNLKIDVWVVSSKGISLYQR